jgi:drug/metabolite transporter (DMT)-like permease
MAYDSSVSAINRSSADERGRSAGDLLRQLLGDVTVLFRKELALAASEVSQSVDQAKHGVQSMITGGAVLYAGALFLLAAITLWLMTMMAAWLAALIVGAAVTLIGIVMLASGKKRVGATELAPERTIASLRKDKHAVERQLP